MIGYLNLCIIMLEELGLSFPTPLPWRYSPCVVELGGWVLWRREAADLDQGFVRCQTWREGILVLVFKINKDVISFFFPNHCSMCDWISVYDHMMMLFRSLVHVYLIILVLYVVKMVWGRYNSFCRSLGARGARRGLKRKLGPTFSLSSVDLYYLWNLLLYACWTLCISLSTPVHWWPLKP